MINEKMIRFFRFPFFALKTDMEWTEDTLTAAPFSPELS